VNLQPIRIPIVNRIGRCNTKSGCLLVRGCRVWNPQSYHSAFRISSTRQEVAVRGAMILYDANFPGNANIKWSRGGSYDLGSPQVRARTFVGGDDAALVQSPVGVPNANKCVFYNRVS
jgi:hypothetical protein